MNTEQIWTEFLNIISMEAGTRIVETWFKAISLVQWDSTSKTAFLKAPNAFVKDWVNTKYINLIKLHLGRLLHEIDINVIISEERVSIPAVIIPVIENTKDTEDSNINLPKKHSPKNNYNKGIINTQYTFDGFIVGPSNSLAFAASQAICDKPGILYNPLFIYGESGLGKTHLLHAIANNIRDINPKAKVLYQTAEKFVQDFINAIRFNKMSFFENRYKDTDILLIDDIQFISNKEQTQEAFFHIFNTLYESKKQIVFSSDALPRDISGLADRLKTRLDGGLIADIQAPTFETKVAIVKKKASMHNELFSDEVANYIASHFAPNVRQLEGYIIRVLAYSSLIQETVTIELVKKVLDIVPKDLSKKAELSLQKIALKVASYYNLSLVDLRSTKRAKDLTLARHIAMYFMKKHTKIPLVEIANFLHRKDHSTVIHALEKIDYNKSKDLIFNQELSKIESKFLGISDFHA